MGNNISESIDSDLQEQQQEEGELNKISDIHKSMINSINQLTERMHVLTVQLHEMLQARGELFDYLNAAAQEKEKEEKKFTDYNMGNDESDESDDDDSSFGKWANVMA